MNHQEQQQQVMEWLPSLLKRTFFGRCSVHNDSDLNRYCMSCHVAACKHCVASATHGGHNVIKIHRHVYKDVVPLADMEAHIDCDMIQPYRCNKKQVISLNPLPHCGSGKRGNNSCHFCMRKLTDPERNPDQKTYSYCSIACKFQLEISSEEEADPEEEANQEEEVSEPQPKRHRRKGIPHRAAV